MCEGRSLFGHHLNAAVRLNYKVYRETLSILHPKVLDYSRRAKWRTSHTNVVSVYSIIVSRKTEPESVRHLDAILSPRLWRSELTGSETIESDLREAFIGRPSMEETILLLGWMERDAAVSYLCRNCAELPPYSESEAESLWREYQARVRALPERVAKSPQRLKLTSEEKDAAEKFLAPHRLSGDFHIRDVVKVDPMGLVIHQLFMTLDTAKEFMADAATPSWCIRHCLAVRPSTPRAMNGNFGTNAAEIEIPHREFAVDFHPGNTFSIVEFAAHVSASQVGDRMLLWAGYHRAYARVASLKAATENSSLLVVLSKDADYLLAPDSPEPQVRTMLLGPRPPMFGDFFDDRLFLKVRLRKRRYELRIRARVEPVCGEA